MTVGQRGRHQPWCSGWGAVLGIQRGLGGQKFGPDRLELTLVLSGTQSAMCLSLRRPHALNLYLQCSERVCGGPWA